jgi:hypothetical protein
MTGPARVPRRNPEQDRVAEAGSLQPRQKETSVTQPAEVKPDRSWSKGRIAFAVMTAGAWLLCGYVLLDVCSLAGGVDWHYRRIDLYMRPVTKVALCLGMWGEKLDILLGILFVAGSIAMFLRMRGRVWRGFAIGSLLLTVLSTFLVLAIFRPFVPQHVCGGPVEREQAGIPESLRNVLVRQALEHVTGDAEIWKKIQNQPYDSAATRVVRDASGFYFVMLQYGSLSCDKLWIVSMKCAPGGRIIGTIVSLHEAE